MHICQHTSMYVCIYVCRDCITSITCIDFSDYSLYTVRGGESLDFCICHSTFRLNPFHRFWDGTGFRSQQVRHPDAKTEPTTPRRANAPSRRFWVRTTVSGGHLAHLGTGRGPVAPFSPVFGRNRCVILAPKPSRPLRGGQTLPRGDFGPGHPFPGAARPSRHRPGPCCALFTGFRPVPLRHPDAQTRHRRRGNVSLDRWKKK